MANGRLDKIRLFMMAVPAAIAASLTVYVMVSGDPALLPFFYAIAPGALTSLLVTGGHGGSALQEMVGRILAALVNAAVYAAVGAGLLHIWRAVADYRGTRNPLPLPPSQ